MNALTRHFSPASNQYLSLLSEFYRRELSAKYRESFLGYAWMIVTPLLMFAAYGVAFSGIIGVQRMSPDFADPIDYLISLYLGLAAFFLISDVLGSSLGLISGRPNYVKKVVFPLSILVITRVLVALTAYVVNVLMVLAFLVIIGRSPGWTVVLMPFAIALVAAQMLGLASALSALSVFLRDIEQVIAPITRMLLFLTPIAYPLSMVPERYQAFFLLNPLTSIVVTTRDVMIQGTLPDAACLTALLAASVLLPVAGVLIFNRLRPGFADVV
jgi:lipopolysaccharide transport system permease protein